MHIFKIQFLSSFLSAHGINPLYSISMYNNINEQILILKSRFNQIELKIVLGMVIQVIFNKYDLIINFVATIEVQSVQTHFPSEKHTLQC